MTIDEHIGHCQGILDEEPGNFEIRGMLADLYDQKGETILADGCRWFIEYNKYPFYFSSFKNKIKLWFFKGLIERRHLCEFVYFHHYLPLFLLDGAASSHMYRTTLESIVFRNIHSKQKELNKFFEDLRNVQIFADKT